MQPQKWREPFLASCPAIPNGRERSPQPIPRVRIDVGRFPVQIISRVRRPGITPRRLQGVAVHVLRRERAARGAGVTIALVSDRAIRTLNRRFLGRNRATDVLAFPARSRDYLGDVAVSVDRARAQARAAGHPVGTEIALLATHGILHLLGHDDRTASARARMGRRQQALLHELRITVRG